MSTSLKTPLRRSLEKPGSRQPRFGQPPASIICLGCPQAERAETEKNLAAAGLSVIWTDNVASVVGQLQQQDLPVLVDLSRGPGAIQSARELRELRHSTVMFAVVDVERPDLTMEAVIAGMADVFARPLRPRHVANALEREYHLAANPAMKTNGNPTEPEDLYTHSSAMRDVIAQIELAGATGGGVTIRGEDGSGRRVIARAIHARHPDGGGPFRAIDFAVFDNGQLDAALFGVAAAKEHGDAAPGLEHVSQGGLLYESNGGTLYLQNVAEASARVQARLARILRDREAVLVETGKTVPIDVRPIAAVAPGNDDPARDGRVREDLFRRLSAVCIEVPPLRKRREDIPTLANYFVREISAALGVTPAVLSRSALSLICALPWRRNAVELRSLLEAIVAGLGDAGGIGIEHVLAQLRLDGDAVALAYGGTLRQARNRFEREYIASVLDRHRGRISEAAKVLGIQRTNLYRKIRVLDVGRGKHVGRGKQDARPFAT